MLADGNLPEEYWEEANHYATFIYNHLPPHGKGSDDKARRSPQELFFDMGPSLLLYYIRPVGIWCYTHVTVQGRKRKYGQSHPGWGSRVRYMGFENDTVVGMRLYSPSTNNVIINSATFPPGPDSNGMQIQRAIGVRSSTFYQGNAPGSPGNDIANRYVISNGC